MPSNIVSQSATWDTRTASFVTTTTLESLTEFPSIPSTAYDVTKSKSDGVYRVTYKDQGDSTGGGGGGGGGGSTYSYECHTSVSTEPLITFGSFGPGGTYALSDTHRDEIKKAEQDSQMW
jgi:hypothetical protein